MTTGLVAGFGYPLGTSRLSEITAHGITVISQDLQTTGGRTPDVAGVIAEAATWSGRTMFGCDSKTIEMVPNGSWVTLYNEPDINGFTPAQWVAAANIARPIIEERNLVFWGGNNSNLSQTSLAWLKEVIRLAPWLPRIAVHRYSPTGVQERTLAHKGFSSRQAEADAFFGIIGNRPYLVGEIGFHMQKVVTGWWIFKKTQQLTAPQQAQMLLDEIAFWQKNKAESCVIFQEQDGAKPYPDIDRYGLRYNGPAAWKTATNYGSGSTPVPPGPTDRPIDIIVRNDANENVNGARVTLYTGVVVEGTTVNGLVQLSIPTTLDDTQLGVYANDYVTVDTHINVAGINQIWNGGGTPGAGVLCLPPMQLAAPPLPTRRTQSELRYLLTNFCNTRDSQNRVCFTPFIISLPENEQNEWLDIQRKFGSTHFVMSPTISYSGSPIPPTDWYNDPKRLVAFMRKVLATPSADGKGFTPILILDGGTQPGFRDRVDTYWKPILDELGPDAVDVIVVPGWELVTASDCSSADYSYALEALHAQGWPHIWAHLSSGRAACSSNPLEADDPWQGGESDCWKSHGGQYVEGFLYQSQAIRPGDEHCDPTLDECWLNRWADVVPRIGAGMNGWRIMPLVYFEGPAYFYYRGQSSEQFPIDAADAAKAMADGFGVKCGYGNGIPSSVWRVS